MTFFKNICIQGFWSQSRNQYRRDKGVKVQIIYLIAFTVVFFPFVIENIKWNMWIEYFFSNLVTIELDTFKNFYVINCLNSNKCTFKVVYSSAILWATSRLKALWKPNTTIWVDSQKGTCVKPMAWYRLHRFVQKNHNFGATY